MSDQTTAVARFDPRATPTIAATRGSSQIATFVPTDFGSLIQMANMMAAAGAAVPKHLRSNPGMCLSVAMTAYNNGFNPFLLGADTYVVNDILSYGAKSIGAMVDNSPQLAEPLNVTFEGTWPNRIAICSGRVRGAPEPRTVRIEAATISVRNSPLWKQQPDQQLLYYAKRAWARAWMPGVLLGMLADDEELAAERATDITPPPRPTRATLERARDPEYDPVTGEVHEPPADDDEVPARNVATEVADAMTQAEPDDGIPLGTYTVQPVFVNGKGNWPATIGLFQQSVAKADALDILNAIVRDNTGRAADGSARLLSHLADGPPAAKDRYAALMQEVNARKSEVMAANPEAHA